MRPTKLRILDSALTLFNGEGIVNVTLQQIADETGISTGNLAYHYRNKDALVESLYAELTEKQQDLLSEYRVVPIFDNIDRLIRHTFELQEQYVFFYLDTLEILRAYPSIGACHQQHIATQVRHLQVILDFNVERGVLIAEPAKGLFEKLAVQLWMTMDMWFTQHAVRMNYPPRAEDYRESVWALLTPYFTDLGRREYDQMLHRPYDFFFE